MMEKRRCHPGLTLTVLPANITSSRVRLVWSSRIFAFLAKADWISNWTSRIPLFLPCWDWDHFNSLCYSIYWIFPIAKCVLTDRLSFIVYCLLSLLHAFPAFEFRSYNGGILLLFLPSIEAQLWLWRLCEGWSKSSCLAEVWARIQRNGRE